MDPIKIDQPERPAPRLGRLSSQHIPQVEVQSSQWPKRLTRLFGAVRPHLHSLCSAKRVGHAELPRAMLGRSSICAVCQSLTVRIGVAGAQGSAQFEGVPAGSDGYSSGFGLTAEPHITVETLTSPPSPHPLPSGAHVPSSMPADAHVGPQPLSCFRIPPRVVAAIRRSNQSTLGPVILYHLR